MGIVEGDDICIIVVIEELSVDFDDFVIIAKDICQRSENARMIASHLREPVTDTLKVDSGKLHTIGSPLNQFSHINDITHKNNQFFGKSNHYSIS